MSRKKKFGKQERVLNWSTHTYQLTRPNKVGQVMDIIRTCSPMSYNEWVKYYFEYAKTKGSNTSPSRRISEEDLNELGNRLYSKITEIVIPEWTAAFNSITLQDCKDYIYNVVIDRTYDGYMTEKSVIYDNLASKFPDVNFKESDPELDHAGDIDFIGIVGEKAIGIKVLPVAFGLQIKPVSNATPILGVNLSERMQHNFDRFSEQYFGKVFIVYSQKEGNKKIIKNTDVIDQIREEIKRLKNL